MKKLVSSDDLINLSRNHLYYLLEIDEISHIGSNNSTLSQRIEDSNVTALTYGEIIGFSHSLEDLFKAWLNSESHKNVIVDPKWNFIGVAVEKTGDVYVSVITFSSGILKAIKYDVIDNVIIVTGNYIQEPIFKSGNKTINYYINKEENTFYFKTVNNKIIQVYNINNQLRDRIELFFW